MSPRFRSIVVALAVILLAALVGGTLGYAVVQIRAGEQAREQRDEAMVQTAQALDELQRVRRNAASERRAFQRHIARLDEQIDSLLEETELLQARIETLSGQVRDLGGQPAPAPPGLEDEEDVGGGSQSSSVQPQSDTTRSSPSQPGNTPDHANRKPDAGPPDHANAH